MEELYHISICLKLIKLFKTIDWVSSLVIALPWNTYTVYDIPIDCGSHVLMEFDYSRSTITVEYLEKLLHPGWTTPLAKHIPI